jgi:hypothetical protein
MMQSILLEKLTERKRETEALLLAGQVDSFDSYRYLVGKIRGLQDAIEIYTEIMQRRSNE